MKSVLDYLNTDVARMSTWKLSFLLLTCLCSFLHCHHPYFVSQFILILVIISIIKSTCTLGIIKWHTRTGVHKITVLEKEKKNLVTANGVENNRVG